MAWKIPKKMLVTNAGIVLIIVFVYIMAFLPFGPLHSGAPVLKGRTGAQNIALQIAVRDDTDVAAYIDRLDALGAKGTFFFPAQGESDASEMIREVKAAGHGVGYYQCDVDDGGCHTLYIGGGYSLPVMNYENNDVVRKVCPSIDMTKLKKQEDWTQILGESVSDDLFVYVEADNDFAEFEKIVQIIRLKGYTILKIHEML
jgi:hypothetical protein